MARILHSRLASALQWVPGIGKTSATPDTLCARLQSPIKNLGWKRDSCLASTWVSSSSKASGRHTWTNIWNWSWWSWLEPWVKEKAPWLKFSNLKTRKNFQLQQLSNLMVNNLFHLCLAGPSLPTGSLCSSSQAGVTSAKLLILLESSQAEPSHSYWSNILSEKYEEPPQNTTFHFHLH